MMNELGLRGWFNDLNVATRLGGAFAIVLLLTALMGAVGLVSIQRVYLASNQLAYNYLPSVKHTGNARALLLEYRDFEAKHARAADEGYMDDYEVKMKELMVRITAELKAYEAIEVSTEEKQVYQAFQKALDAYLVVNKKVIALGRAKKQDDAKDINEGASIISSDEALTAIDKLTAYNFTGAEAVEKAAEKEYKFKTQLMIGAMLFAVLCGIGLAYLITKAILRQLGAEPSELASVAQRVASGDLAFSVGTKSGDSSSVMARLAQMQTKLAEVVTQVRQGSEAVATASAEIAEGNHDLSARTESQASALEETAASMEELSSQVKNNADNARQANQLASNASAVAAKGGEVVGRVVHTMKDINDSSRKIADIISVIDGIAFQTNILALNAAVEAARAGEQGRGFAVVASEVRSLAGRSAEAAKEIKRLINASVEKVEHGTALVDEAGTTMTEVVTSISRVSDLVGEISSASNEQAAGVAQVGEAVTQMDQATQQNAALVEQMAAAASGLKSQAGELVGTVAVFKLSSSDSMVKTSVRSSAPKSMSIKVPERRDIEMVASKPKTGTSRPAAPKPVQLPRQTPIAKRSTGGDDDWETF